MSVFVINEDQIKKIIFAFVAAVIISFLLGYFTGSGNLFESDSSDQFDNLQKNQTSEESQVKNDQTGSALKPEEKDALEDKNIADKEAAEKKATEKKSAEKKSEAKKIAEKKKADRKAAEKKKAAEKRLAEKKKAENKAAKKKLEEAKKQAEIKEAARKKQAEKDAVVDDVSQTLINTSDADVLSENTNVEAVSGSRFYSIQAGMFASESNADSFIEKLSEKQFDAYVSSFVSSSGATKYNVRVGKFEKRDQARTLLKKFQKSFSSPAYVVITH